MVFPLTAAASAWSSVAYPAPPTISRPFPGLDLDFGVLPAPDGNSAERAVRDADGLPPAAGARGGQNDLLFPDGNPVWHRFIKSRFETDFVNHHHHLG